jgi:hypothetical protein
MQGRDRAGPACCSPHRRAVEAGGVVDDIIMRQLRRRRYEFVHLRWPESTRTERPFRFVPKFRSLADPDAVLPA